MNKNFICRCGHLKKEHNLKEKACWFCAISGPWCEQFVGDNLKYLELAASDLTNIKEI